MKVIKDKICIEKEILRQIFVSYKVKKKLIPYKINYDKIKTEFVHFLCFIKLIYCYTIYGNIIYIYLKTKNTISKLYSIKKSKLSIASSFNTFIKYNCHLFQQNVYYILKTKLSYSLSKKTIGFCFVIALI